jgi:hypothetical protein
VTHLTSAQKWAGGGAMVGAIAAATQREPVVVGKPSTFMLDHICNSFGISKAEICMVVRSPPANCIIIDHFSAFEPGLVALFRELLLKNGWQYVKTARNLNLGVSRNSFCDFLLTLIAEVSAVLGRLLCKSQYTYFSTHLLCKLLATLSLARSVPRLRRRFTKANPGQLAVRKHCSKQSEFCVEQGDRLDTDIAFGQAGGVSTLLVLSGVTTEAALLSAENSIHPDCYTDALPDLLEHT